MYSIFESSFAKEQEAIKFSVQVKTSSFLQVK